MNDREKLLCEPAEPTAYGLHCAVCGSPYFPGRVCIRKSEIVGELPEIEWGDRTEMILGSFGVTKDFYKAAKKAVGLAPECDCCGRQEKLNEWSRKAKAWWRGKNRKKPAG